MPFNVLNQYSSQMANLALLMTLVNAVVHILFAGAVAKDAGEMTKLGQKTLLTSGIVWSFATLVGGVFIAAVYWFMHHSKFTRI